jgi:hypothetical protein
MSPEIAAGRAAYRTSQSKADEIVAWAKTPDGKLDPAKVATLLSGTGLPVDQVRSMTADEFRQKLARSWALSVDAIYKNKPAQ